MAPSSSALLLEDQFKTLCSALGALAATWRGSDVTRSRLAAAASVLVDHVALHVATLQVIPYSRDVARTTRDALLATRALLTALDRAGREGTTPELRRAALGARRLLDALTPVSEVAIEWSEDLLRN